MKDSGIEFINDNNLTITSDMDIFDIQYRKDKYYFMNIDNFVKFIKGCERNIRKHPDYDMFVSTIRELHMDHCQVLGNIDRFDATIEMHHGPMLTLFDYCAIVVDSLISRNESNINTFKVAKIILDEHYKEHIQVVMLSKTVHQAVDSGELFINLNQGIGNVNEFLKEYKDGLHNYKDKINKYIDLSKKFKSHDSNIFDLEDKMISWNYRDLPNEISKRI